MLFSEALKVSSGVCKYAQAALLCIVSWPAAAHVTLEYQVANAGSYYKGTFKVGHGCGTSPVRQMVVTIPATSACSGPRHSPPCRPRHCQCCPSADRRISSTTRRWQRHCSTSVGADCRFRPCSCGGCCGSNDSTWDDDPRRALCLDRLHEIRELAAVPLVADRLRVG